MARYVIGDIQGCFDELMLLLQRLGFDAAHDRLWLVGDLVNRGPHSLEVLRWVMAQGNAVQTVLGNHDLHLLAVATGIAKRKAGDTLDAVLADPQCMVFCDWLRRQPLLIDLGDALLVHAGIWPGWNKAKALDAAAAVENVLRGEHWRDFLQEMYGSHPTHWGEAKGKTERLRFTVNACTRMRFVDQHLHLNLKYKGELEQAPAGLQPWFAAAERKKVPRVVCGHWSALGLRLTDEMWATDTGCIWGGQLTAVDLDRGAVVQQAALQHYQDVTAE